MFILKAPLKSARRKHWKICESIFRRKSLPPNYEQPRMDYRNVRFKKCWYQREHHYLATLIVGHTKEIWSRRNNICIFFIKTPRCNCYFVSLLLQLLFCDLQMTIAKHFYMDSIKFLIPKWREGWILMIFYYFFFCQGTRQAIFKMFQIWAKYPRLERISSYVFFIWNICKQ